MDLVVPHLNVIENSFEIGPIHRRLNIVGSEDVRVQLIGHDRTIGAHDVRLAELDLRLQCTETTNYEGCLIWKINEYRRRKREAIEGHELLLIVNDHIPSDVRVSKTRSV